jgi:tetratricopeptide (TPR) repeat protein
MKMFTMQAARWTAVSILAFGLEAAGASVAFASDATSVGHKGQQAANSAVAPDVPEMTPEMTADLLVARHKYMDAIEAYRKIKPQTAQTYNKIGVAYEHMSMNDDAKAYYMRAIKADGKFADAYNNLGTVYFREKDYRESERMYRKAIKANNKNASYFNNLGTLYIASRRFHDGVEAYQRAFVLDANIFQAAAARGIHDDSSSDDIAQMNFCFAEIYAQAGMKVEAVEYLQKAIAAGFHDPAGLRDDPEFASLHGMPEFQQLTASHSR